MIKKKSVFIVGAGASVPYGLPTGAELLRDLKLNGSMPVTDDAHFPAGFVSHVNKEFRKLLTEAAPASIDDFLRDRPDQMERGKLWLAKALVAAESPQRMFNPGIEGDWMKELWHQVKGAKGDFGQNKMKFVVYNYDRAIEHFFTTVLSSTFQTHLQEAYSQVTGMVLHPHGLLSPYAVPGYYGGDAASYGCESKYVPHAAIQAVRYIHLFWEDKPEQQSVRKAITEAIQKAERIVFLGFGFLKSNMDFLSPLIAGSANVLQPREIFGTCKGLSKLDRVRVEKELKGIQLVDVDCLDLLKNHVLLD